MNELSPEPPAPHPSAPSGAALLYLKFESGNFYLVNSANLSGLTGVPEERFWTREKRWAEVCHPQDVLLLNYHSHLLALKGATFTCFYRVRDGRGLWQLVLQRFEARDKGKYGNFWQTAVYLPEQAPADLDYGVVQICLFPAAVLLGRQGRPLAWNELAELSLPSPSQARLSSGSSVLLRAEGSAEGVPYTRSWDCALGKLVLPRLLPSAEQELHAMRWVSLFNQIRQLAPVFSPMEFKERNILFVRVLAEALQAEHGVLSYFDPEQNPEINYMNHLPVFYQGQEVSLGQVFHRSPLWEDALLLGRPVARDEKTRVELEPGRVVIFRNQLALPVFALGKLQLMVSLANLSHWPEPENLDRLFRMVQYFQQSVSEERKAQKLRKSESRLKMALAATNTGVWEWNITTKEIYYSPEWGKVLGFNPKETSQMGQLRPDVIHPEDFGALMEAMNDHFQARAPLYRSEHRIRDKQGRWVWTMAQGLLTERDDMGRPARMLGIFQDITQKKQAEIELREAKAKAERSDWLKSAFLANMSHEIRTPLNGIVGFSNLLADEGNTTEERREFSNIVKDCSNRLMTLVNDIIDISKIEAGQMAVHKASVPLRDKLETWFAYYLTLQNGLRYDLSISILPIHEQVHTDFQRLSQILTNLLDNATKFTDKGGIRVSCESIGPRELLFKVADTGVGLTPDECERIFTRFVQTDASHTKRAQGAGLGLSISRHLAQLLGGDLWVESQKGVGSIFQFSILTEREAGSEHLPA